ncbi:uncharacterized protein DS421_16g537910 [Arachis hypogaea]|nr:uncharacterized protein DS421_16g537910 [Arachis hypogaea]
MGGRLSAMKKRLEFQPNLLINPSGDRVSSSAIISNLEPTPRLEGGREGQGPEVHNLEKDSHTNSPLKKKPKNKDAKLGLAKMPLEDALSRVQRMLLRPTTYVQDAEVKDSNLHAEFVVKDKEIANANTQIQNLNNSITTL